jgi:hypothetical protein
MFSMFSIFDFAGGDFGPPCSAYDLTYFWAIRATVHADEFTDDQGEDLHSSSTVVVEDKLRGKTCGGEITHNIA